ncbi:hypothetical protein [Candidatus Tisiphia endosymbiont of Beris chalybata]|uniref:hypothetical protein n=1 Tax=Candidatus Tisiphia endosymbiont of Beris chalybata TaxID=3066262 RepID=UPI00312CA576
MYTQTLKYLSRFCKNAYKSTHYTARTSRIGFYFKWRARAAYMPVREHVSP